MNGNQPEVPEGRYRGNHYQDRTAYCSTARAIPFHLRNSVPKGAPGSKDTFERLHISQLLHEHIPVQVLRPPSTLFHVKHQLCPIIRVHLRP